MEFELIDIPELELPADCERRIRALQINGKSPAIAALVEWKRKNLKDYTKIINVMRLIAERGRLTDEKHVKKTSKPDKHGDVYEMRAHRGKARLFFFYDHLDDSLIICTNEYNKGKGDQDNAFSKCGSFKELYEGHYHSR